MFYKGSKKYPTPYVISSSIEGLGGVWNAFTSKDYTGYWIKAASYNASKIVDILSDMLLNPLLLESEITKEKGVIKEEINMYEDTPQRKVSELFDNLIYGGSTLGFDIIGTKKTISGFTRNTFNNYMNKLYYPNNAVLTISGGLSELNGYKKLIGDKFAPWLPGRLSELKAVKEFQQKPNVLIKFKKTEQVHFCFGFRAFSFFDERTPALVVLATLLGGGASSRLFTELRERRGLCYYVSTWIDQYADVGNIITQAGVTKNIDKLKKAIESTLKVHTSIFNEDLKQSDINTAKEIIKGRLLLSLEDTFKQAFYYGRRLLLENKIEDPKEYLNKIDKVSKEEVIFLSKELFRSERLNLALIGPISNQHGEIESLL
jgi:predicted Zn-dependent peptidase